MKNMRLVLIFSTVFFIGALGWSQSKQIQLDWNTLNQVSFSKVAPKAKLRATKEHTIFTQRWEDTQRVLPSSATLNNVQFALASDKELQDVQRTAIPDSLQFSLNTLQARDRYTTFFSIFPFIKRNGQIQKIIGGTLAYKYQTTNVQRQKVPLSQSVLASGDWYKFKVGETGVYKVDGRFLEQLGFNLNSINPIQLKVFGHGGKALPYLNSDNQYFDIPETPIQTFGLEDGVFNRDDYFLFYGIGTRGFDAENDTHINPFADTSYYYVTANGGAGKRIQTLAEPTSAPNVVFNAFTDYQYHEVDDFNPGKVGRRWLGNRFDVENVQEYVFNFPNIVSGERATITYKTAAVSESSTSLEVTLNNNPIAGVSFLATSSSNLVNFRVNNVDIDNPTETFALNFSYNNANNPSSIAYIDYIRIQAQRSLIGSDTQFAFRNLRAASDLGVGEYQISNFAAYQAVWDVTDITQIQAKPNLESASEFTFKSNLGTLREYVAVHESQFLLPETISNARVTNQNIKGTIFTDAEGNFKDVDYLIVAPSFLMQPALRLAAHREAVSGVRTKVVRLEEIYEEFSSGKQDIVAIRNLVRYIYENASTPNNRIKYVCLFGDSSVDYKNRLQGNNNIVPVFHALKSGSSLSSFMSDDFYGMMDPFEGNVSTFDGLDIAVGRILADNVALANTLVTKIINYDTKPSFGNWRTNFVLVSDDVDEFYEHQALQVNLDDLGDEISVEKPFVNVKKIHTDAFQQQTSAGGSRYPEVNQAISNAVEVGAILINYFGHGGEDGLAKEFIFTRQQAEELQNFNKYPCIVTVTCEFTKFDNPQRITAGELTYWNERAGAISLITTTRSITVTTGVEYNQELAPVLFGYNTNVLNTPAEALRVAKNNIQNADKRVALFIGDPAMPLALPPPGVNLTHVNEVPIRESLDTLKALDRVKLAGEVVDFNGKIIEDYQGEVEVKLFDKNIQRTTLGNDGVRDGNGDLLLMDFETLGEILFNGKATVDNGKFEINFVMPRDTKIEVGKGRLSLYAQRNTALENQAGADLNLRIGGLNENAEEDNVGPTITLFMNDESFVNGGITNDSPVLIAKLEDENGINTASGIGHDIIAILDNDEANPFILNEYYQADTDNFSKGALSYRLRNLEEGPHTLRVRAWDVYNNSSTQEIQFVVAGDQKLEITRVLNYPNPFVNYTEFWFNHNRPYEPLDVQIQVFTVSGKIVWTQNQTIVTEGFLSRDIVWDGRDDFGDKIGKGVYVYKITVKSTLTNKQVEKFEKLVIL